jgi:hypothetical protein
MYVCEKLPHLNWSVQDMSRAVVILAKIRGQLRPLRHAGFDLNEFAFGMVRNSVPTELRPDVLASWHRIQDPKQKTHEILGDVWKIATIRSVIEGRNIPLYQSPTVAPHLIEEEQQSIVRAIETAIPLWVATQEKPTFHFMMELPGIRPIRFDMMTERCAYDIFFDPSFVPSQEDNILLLLKQYVYEELFDRVLESIGFVNVSTGMVLQYDVTPTIREQLSHMWQHLQCKYRLDSSSCEVVS